MIVTIRNRLLIKLAWGPRRVTNSTRYGTLRPEDAYPRCVTAGDNIWLMWLRDGLRRWFRFLILRDVSAQYIVVPERKAEARIRSAIADIVEREKAAQDQAAPPPAQLDDPTIATMLAQREALRRERRFEEADAIRSALIERGVVVADHKSIKNQEPSK